MSRVTSQDPLLPSVLDRLIDYEPEVSTESGWQRAQGLSELQLSVARDLEALLNTRRVRADVPDSLPEVQQSILTYGLPEFNTLGSGTKFEYELLRRAILQTLQWFEPRLHQVEVTLHEVKETERVLRLTIDGVLWVDPHPVAVRFNTLLESASGQCRVNPE